MWRKQLILKPPAFVLCVFLVLGLYVFRPYAAETNQKTVSALIQALKDDDRDVRMEAAESLGEIGPEAKAAVPALIQALKDDNFNVRRGAAMALLTIGTPEALKAVEQYKSKERG